MPPHSATAPRARSLDTISVWTLLATLVVAIAAVTPSVAVSISTTKIFILAGGALITSALYILARLSRGNIILPPLMFVGALWLPVLAYAISTLFSGVSPASAFWGSLLNQDTLGFMLVAAVLATITALVLRRPEQYRTFFATGAWTLGAVAVVHVLAIGVGQFAPDVISPTFSVLGSPGDLAFLLGLGAVGVLITLRFLELSRRTRTMLLGVLVLALVLLAVYNSTLVWILVALAALGLFVEAVMRRGAQSSESELEEVTVIDESPLPAEGGSHSLVIPLGTLAVSLFFIIGSTLGGALATALEVNTLSVRPSWEATLSVADQVYATNSIFGTGPGTFGINWLKHRDPALNANVFWNLDFDAGIGFIPTSIATLGAVGAIGWLAFFVLLVVFGFRTLILRAPRDPFARYAAILSFVASVYLFTIVIFDLPSPVIIVLAFVFAGLFASTTRFAERAGQWGIVFARSPRLGFVIVFALTLAVLSSVIAGYVLVERYVAAIEYARAASALAANDVGAADQAIQSSLSFAPTPATYQLQASIANARVSQIVSSPSLPATVAQQQFQAALSGGINAALTATRSAPEDYRSWVILGNLYAQAVPLGVSGAYEGAKTAYEKARVQNPTNPQILYILAQLEIAHRDVRAAAEALRAAIALKQDYTAAIFLLSQVEVASGNVKEALASALAAAYFTPNDPNILFQVGVLRAASGDLPGAVEALSAAVDASPQFANARYFLAAVRAKQGNLAEALAQLQAIAALSSENAKAVASSIATLQAGKNPFPANLLSVSPAPVK